METSCNWLHPVQSSPPTLIYHPAVCVTTHCLLLVAHVHSIHTTEYTSSAEEQILYKQLTIPFVLSSSSELQPVSEDKH